MVQDICPGLWQPSQGVDFQGQTADDACSGYPVCAALHTVCTRSARTHCGDAWSLLLHVWYTHGLSMCILRISPRPHSNALQKALFVAPASNTLYFAAKDAEHGIELWKIGEPNPPLPPTRCVACGWSNSGRDVSTPMP